MRRMVIAAVAVLATATSLALLGVGFAIQPPPMPRESERADEAGNRAIVRAFYDAVNAVIATGDPSLLTAEVPPGFVTPEDPSEAGTRRDHLVRHLLAVHAADPAVRIEIATLAAEGDVVIAHVWIRAIVGPTLENLRLGASWMPWPPVDVFRLAGGRIVERWGPSGEAAPPEQVIRFGPDDFPAGRRSLDVLRIAIAPGATYHLADDMSPRLIAVLDGEVRVEPTPASNGPAGQDGDARRAARAISGTLAAGDYIVPETGPELALQNNGTTTAVLLDLAFRTPPLDDGWNAHPGAIEDAVRMLPSEPGVTVETIAEGLVVTMPARPSTIAVARVTLSPAELLRWSPSAGPVIVHVDAGDVAIDANGPVPWLQSTDRNRATARDGSETVRGNLVERGEALLDASADFELRAGVPGATISIVAILPE